MLKSGLSRNYLLYAVIILILAGSVDWKKCHAQRGRYLLGIVYNGHFQNANDGVVYTDYLKRHGSTHEEFAEGL